MTVEPAAVRLVPPLRLSWKSSIILDVAIASDSSLYGVTGSGKIVALRATDGVQRWQSTGNYLPRKMALQGNRLFAYQEGMGFTFLDDMGTSVSEKLWLSFPAAMSTSVSMPLVVDQMTYIAVNRGLYAAHQDDGLLFGTVLNEVVPHGLGLAPSGDIITIDGAGIPSRYRINQQKFEVVWNASRDYAGTGQTERPFVIAGDRVIVAVGQDLVAYDLASGALSWRKTNLPANALAAQGGVIYTGFHGVAVRALNATTGGLLWERQYVYDISIHRDYALTLAGDYLYYGGSLQTNPDGALLMAIRASDGGFVWLSRSAAGQWAGGLPIAAGNRVFIYGAGHTGAYEPLAQAPKVTTDQISANPGVLRGPASGFGTGQVFVNLPVSAKVSIAAYREREGLGTPITNNANWSAGSHDASWSLAGAGGFTDRNQFGYLLVDVAETGGPSYSQTLLTPVNTFPDILWHWARESIEIMAYHKYVSGYPDQTFGPANLVTRAESCTIIAKTLNLEGPSSGFKSKLTDIATHWARNYIMALEERGIVSGIQEPDGTFTFRPNLNMTRSQEARILVRAYGISPAPPSFVTKFTDIKGHWAEADIKALEAGGYVTGILEPDGTYTYRPEQNLSRAELCTMVVRIRNLTR